jgi:hypothetical protein
MNQHVAHVNIEKYNLVLEIEQEVLGAILVSGNHAAVRGTIKAEHFLEPFHRRIFENIELAAERYKTARLDLVVKLFTAEEAAQCFERLKMTVTAYLAKLAANTTGGVAQLPASMANLIQEWARVTVGAEAERISLAAADPVVDPAELIRTATRSLDDIATGLRGGVKGRTRYSLSEAADGDRHEDLASSARSGAPVLHREVIVAGLRARICDGLRRSRRHRPALPSNCRRGLRLPHSPFMGPAPRSSCVADPVVAFLRSFIRCYRQIHRAQ